MTNASQSHLAIRLALTTALLCLSLALAALAGTPPLAFVASAYADSKDRALKAPQGVACNDQGAVLVADTGNARLVRYDWLDGSLRGGVEFKLAQATLPVRAQFEATGNALVLDQKTRRIVRVGAKGEFLGVLDGAEVPEPALFPVAFKAAPQGGVAVLDVAAARVVVLDANGKFVRQVPLPKGLQAADVAIDGAGGLFVIDTAKGQLFKAAPSGQAFEAFGAPLKEFMSFPGYLALAPRGGLVVVDRHGSGVLRVSPSGDFQGRQLSMGWSDGLVYYPSEICIDGKGTTFVADRNNNRLQVFTQSE
jgi:streptogramin lyase